MLLVLKRSPEQDAALEELLAEQQRPGSSNYHRWLTPDQFGQRFGVADSDIQATTNWLQSHGFHVDVVAAGRGAIEFSGTAAQVEAAFHTAIHAFDIRGRRHFANVNDPEIPAVLSHAIAGIANLHDFFSQPVHVLKGQRSHSVWAYDHSLAPSDFATIYNLNPLYSSGINGTGATIAIVGRSNINLDDVNDFRSVFKLPFNPPQIILNGPDPGNLGGDEELEAVLDNSWAGAVAPYAKILFVVSASTIVSDGALLSEEYIVNHSAELGVDVMSESFSFCEAHRTVAYANLVSSLAQQAAAEGITFVAASGDTGATGCDIASERFATGPLSVNLLASSPYVTAVGGTQFNEGAGGGTYWLDNSRTPSVKSYIPEEAWNQSCGPACDDPNVIAGGGGFSVVFSKPLWQKGVAGIPDDGARDLPDVSLAASWDHDPYLVCVEGSCRGRNPEFMEMGGTSVSTPAFAGMLALVRQKAGYRQGPVNSVLYELAAAQDLSLCNASSGLPDVRCIFNDVTVGDNSVPGAAGYGIDNAPYQAHRGYDLATGLGSVNGANLVNQWPIQGAATPSIVWCSTESWDESTEARTITIEGTGFQPGATLMVQPTGDEPFAKTRLKVSISSLSSTQIQAQIFTGDRSGILVVSVLNPDGCQSNQVRLTVNGASKRRIR